MKRLRRIGLVVLLATVLLFCNCQSRTQRAPQPQPKAQEEIPKPLVDWRAAWEYVKYNRGHATLRITKIHHHSEEVWVYLLDGDKEYDFGWGSRCYDQPDDAEILDFYYDLGFILFFLKQPPSDAAKIKIVDEHDRPVAFGPVKLLLHK